MARIGVGRVLVGLLVFAFVVVCLLTPTCCNAARGLRDSSETRSLSEETQEFEKRSSNWSDQQSGDDSVPSSNAVKYNNWVRLQEEQLVTQDYGDTPAAANPSVPCC